MNAFLFLQDSWRLGDMRSVQRNVIGEHEIPYFSIVYYLLLLCYIFTGAVQERGSRPQSSRGPLTFSFCREFDLMSTIDVACT